MMRQKRFLMGHIPAVLWGERAPKLFLFVHGRGGSKEEAEAFAQVVCPRGFQVLGIDLPGHGERQIETDAFDPWHAVPDLRTVLAYAQSSWTHLFLRANSIGAWFSMLSYQNAPLEQCLFVSPLLDMVRLIQDEMAQAGISENRLAREGEIEVPGGEKLSWRYYTFAQRHPITSWPHPTAILYAGEDVLTSRKTVESFCTKHACRLTVMEGGEHWFHTPVQLAFMRRWEEESLG